MKYIELFAGIGAFHYSFRKHGFECVMAAEIDGAARATYFENYGVTPLGDVANINPADIEPYDILTAGFPCQPFSQIGRQGSLDDTRGGLFNYIMKFVRCNAPRFIILENVPRLLTIDGGRTFESMNVQLNNEGYSVAHRVLQCSDYGLPQSRKRVFVIAVKGSAVGPNALFNLESYKSNTTLSSLLGKDFDREHSRTIRCGGRLSPIDSRHNWDGYMVEGVPYRLSVSDCKALQGFGPTFKLMGTTTDQYRLLGNAIPTVLTDMLAQQLLKYL